MKWHNLKKTIITQLNDKRIVRQFLFFPKRLDGLTKWMEEVKFIQRRVFVVKEQIDLINNAKLVRTTETWVDHCWI